MSRARAISCAVALTCAIAACKSDDKQDLGAAFIARYCGAYQPCCMAAGLPTDGATCRALFAAGASATAAYDATQGEACLVGLQQAAGQPGFCEGDVVPPSACARAFGGATGSACIQDGDCTRTPEGESVCVSGFVNGMAVRKCQVQAPGQLGTMPCVGSVRDGVTLYGGGSGTDIPAVGYLCDAADGLRCDGSACVALKAPGELCELSGDCAEADFCDATTGACAARKPIGADCLGQALECQGGSFCDETALTCAARRDMGAACTDNVQCLTGNCIDDVCAPTPPIGPNALCGA